MLPSFFTQLARAAKLRQYRIVRTPTATLVHIRGFSLDYERQLVERMGTAVSRIRYELKGAETIYSVQPGHLLTFQEALGEFGWAEEAKPMSGFAHFITGRR